MRTISDFGDLEWRITSDTFDDFCGFSVAYALALASLAVSLGEPPEGDTVPYLFFLFSLTLNNKVFQSYFSKLFYLTNFEKVLNSRC